MTGRASCTGCDRRIQFFVDQGFVVLVPNYQGSTGFGDKRARFRHDDDMIADITTGVDYLKGLMSVDAPHIDVVGFSFGGYLALPQHRSRARVVRCSDRFPTYQN